MKKEDISAFANCLSKSFQGYPLFEYFSGNAYDIETMSEFFAMNLRTNEAVVGLSTSKNLEGIALFVPPWQKEINLLGYIQAGGIRVVKKMGLSAVSRMLQFENFAEKIKKKHQTERCWYFLMLGVLPEHRGMGYGSSLVKPVLAYLDAKGQDCYLETLVPKNVEIYKRYGFQLMESALIPNTSMTLYAMLRKAERNEVE